jgi:hypothetical protein
MTTKEHKQRHIKLHKALDELIADWVSVTDRVPSEATEATVMSLIVWSHAQTINPTPRPSVNEQ